LPAPVREAVTDTGGGAALSPEVSAALRRGLGVDPSPVRVHTDARAAAATARLGVRAFTWGSHVYLGPGERADDVGLLAHEVAHAIQQSGAAAVQLFDGPHGALEAEAHRTAGVVLAGGRAQVRGRTSGPVVQGLFGWAREGLSAIGGAISSAASAVIDVGAALRDKLLGFVKDKAASLPGYDLLAFVIGRDPITQQPMPRTAVTLVRAVLGLVPGGHALFENLQKANVIQRAFDWLAAETAKLDLTWSSVRALFAQAWEKLSLSDLASPSGAWEKLKNIFGPPLRRLADFAVAAGGKVLELVFEGALAIAGSAGQEILAIFRRMGAVFSLVVADPLKFLGNLLSAVKGGFGKFKDNIVAHLRTGLFEWLLGSLEGVTLPKTWDFAGILHLVLEILGLTYTALRGVLVKLIGEPAVAAMEKAFDFLVLVVSKGLGAAWDKIKEFATDLTDQVIGGIRDWVVKSVVGAAVTKLVTMFNPVGAIIQGIIVIYDTVRFFIERAKQIARLAGAVVDSVENIARGNLSGAIAYVERTMASTLPVILGFLGRLLGLGNVTKYVRDIITKIRTTIAGAFEKVGLWIKDKVKSLVGGKADPAAPSGVRGKALAELVKAAGGGLAYDDLKPVVQRVGGSLRAEGLEKLELAGVDDDGSAVISAQASPFTPLARFVPRGTVPRGTSVRAILELRLSQPVTLAPTTIPTVGLPARRTEGGAILPSPTARQMARRGLDPETEQRTVRSAHWNTTPQSLNVTANTSHAEHQMVAWAESGQVKALYPDIETITVNLQQLSPCSACVNELTDLISTLDAARRSELREAKPFKGGNGNAVLTWTKLYLGARKIGGDNRTIPGHITALFKSGWTIHAPSDAHPEQSAELARGLINPAPPGS
jgi:hypothetical protein